MEQKKQTNLEQGKHPNAVVEVIMSILRMVPQELSVTPVLTSSKPEDLDALASENPSRQPWPSNLSPVKLDALYREINREARSGYATRGYMDRYRH